MKTLAIIENARAEQISEGAIARDPVATSLKPPGEEPREASGVRLPAVAFAKAGPACRRFGDVPRHDYLPMNEPARTTGCNGTPPHLQPAFQTVSPDGYGDLDDVALKEKYVEFVQPRSANSATLSQIIFVLVRRGVRRQTLTRWGIESGCSKSYVSSLLSRIFSALGLRQRRPGAGRKPSPAILALLVELRNRYGGRLRKVLRATERAAQAQEEADRSRSLTHVGRVPSRGEPSVTRLPSRDDLSSLQTVCEAS